MARKIKIARFTIPTGAGTARLGQIATRALDEFERAHGRRPTGLRYPSYGGWHERLARTAVVYAVRLVEDASLPQRTFVIEGR